MGQVLFTYPDPSLVSSTLHEPASRAFSILTLSAGWPEDLERLVTSLAVHCAGLDYEVVAASNASPALEESIERLARSDSRVRGLCFSQHVGFGGARNAGIRQARGSILVIADTSIEATGDFLSPIAGALADPRVGLAGAWGLLSEDLRSFHEEPEGEVDALQAYCIAFRRRDVTEDRLFDPKYRFYRNADIDLSLRWRSQGFCLLALPLPLRRHAHREWEQLTEEQRARKSRDNFARLLRAWRDRTDLLTGRAKRD
jgi:GT2 family glycosyltransferase